MKLEIGQNGWMTVSQLARKNLVTPQAIYMAIRQKRIDAKKIGKTILVRE
jgi:hypothetical protein